MVANAGHFSLVLDAKLCDSQHYLYMQFQWEIFIAILAIVHEKNVPQVFYHSGHVFHAIGIQNIQS